MIDDGFWGRVDASGDCWSWTGTQQSAGYGKWPHRGSSVLAHRYAFEQLVGPIPSDRQIDHLCRNRLCVNPDHLEAVPQRTNILRGTSPSARHARVTKCPHGHPYDSTNTATRADGRRYCRTCDRARSAAAYQARKEGLAL